MCINGPQEMASDHNSDCIEWCIKWQQQLSHQEMQGQPVNVSYLWVYLIGLSDLQTCQVQNMSSSLCYINGEVEVWRG